MNILNGKSTGRRLVMIAVNGNRQSSEKIHTDNPLNFGLLKLIRSWSVPSQ